MATSAKNGGLHSEYKWIYFVAFYFRMHLVTYVPQQHHRPSSYLHNYTTDIITMNDIQHVKYHPMNLMIRMYLFIAPGSKDHFFVIKSSYELIPGIDNLYACISLLFCCIKQAFLDTWEYLFHFFHQIAHWYVWFCTIVTPNNPQLYVVYKISIPSYKKQKGHAYDKMLNKIWVTLEQTSFSSHKETICSSNAYKKKVNC